MIDPIENALNELASLLGSNEASNRIAMTIDTSPERYLEAIERSEIEYERIRNDTTDINKIADTLSSPENVVERVKNHIFFDEHEIVYQDNSIRHGRLDPDPEIVNAWDRLACNSCISSDYEFFMHEEYESLIEKRDGLTYNEAHKRTIEIGLVWNLKED
ncbi:hypothetical protein N3Z97_12540 [Enterobacter hormaechei]|uniref:hypothetical protein n=1 Tax=Enterobacteriaceae TaxID=543 RepID=UPI000BE2C9A7|nr:MULTISPECIES: hypothetical protein [Enterobacteriaceae]HAV1884407.1 hypothetical protein [Enterobacter hormaechei subsp. xiangfangensis]ELC6398835.1 hypothetical protein [Enterobacter hormaechei]ELC7444268.1 hypothetical protein [Enterobacter hormaechei]MCE1565955.1 hypothetical protein [Enterobacter hormaechei]MCW3144578.1 hypothetical protein [Enterobacter hormaechei]